MKTHRPWQPHVSAPPLFGPFIPSTLTTLDHYDMVGEEEELDESTASEDLLADQARDPPPLMKWD
jgi:hypothetical protein